MVSPENIDSGHSNFKLDDRSGRRYHNVAHLHLDARSPNPTLRATRFKTGRCGIRPLSGSCRRCQVRSLLRNFGLKIGIAGGTKFEARIKELVENLPDLAVLVEPLLIVSRVLHEQIAVLHRRLLTVVRDDEVCRRLMTVPGVGPVVALTYRAAVDVPPRFITISATQSQPYLRPGRANLSCGLRKLRAPPEQSTLSA
jgi:hypothetical protein